MVGRRHQFRELVHSDGNVGLEEVAGVGVEEGEEEDRSHALPVKPILYCLLRFRELSPLMT